MSRPVFRGRSFPWLHTDEIADLLNELAGRNAWDAQRVRRWLLRAGAATKVGGRWVTTRDALREQLPALWAELLVRLTDPLAEDEDEDEDEEEEEVDDAA